MASLHYSATDARTGRILYSGHDKATRDSIAEYEESRGRPAARHDPNPRYLDYLRGGLAALRRREPRE